MSEQNKENSSWFKPWWKGLLILVFFPFTISYLIWKQHWKMPIKIGAIALFWIFFIAVGSSSDSSKEQVDSNTNQQVAEETISTPTPAPLLITLEQKQSDFKLFYADYQKQAQAVILVQTSLSELANKSESLAELYLSLDKLSTIQSNLSENDIKVPDSLKEYKDLNSVAFQVKLAASHFKNAIESMKEYVNKNDLEKLKSAKQKQQLGEENLNESMDKIEKVAQELKIDMEALKLETQ